MWYNAFRMEEKLTPPKPLWTKDFTIITLGSTVSLLGNALAGFAMSLFVLDFTSNALLYAVFLAVFTLPQIIVPFVSGAFLDRFSRKKTIYRLDFLSALIYSVFGLVMKAGWFSFPLLAAVTFLVGTIQSVYIVAYESFYPMLISEGNYTKAYSISSVLETLTSVMVPVSAFLYNLVGIFPLLEITALFFLIAAIVETRVTAEEPYVNTRQSDKKELPLFGRIRSDLREGIRYLKSEKGLLAITLYFTFCFLGYGASNTITLPYFKSTFPNGEYTYTVVWGMSVIGRALGGALYYNIKIPAKKKYSITVAVYILTALIEGFYLYTTVPFMMAVCFFSGLLSVTSYTIRVSATQSYVPNEKRGRFNGIFNMLTTTGSFVGELLAGLLALTFSPRHVLTAFMLMNVVMVIIFIVGKKSKVSGIYNRDQ